VIGTLLGNRYEVSTLIADGPIFATYASRDVTQGREVSLRILQAPLDREIAFFKALEVAVEKYRSVQSPNLEPIWRAATENGVSYLVGDLTKGPSLAERIRRLAPFSVPVSVASGISLCTALDSLHRAGLAHGDVSAQNVVVLANGDLKLQMAGIWEAYGASDNAGGMLLPSMAPYLAAEWGEGGYPSPQSDVYAVGVILYELLVGRPPFQGETVTATAFRHRDQPIPSVRTQNPSVPIVLDEIIAKCLAKDPADRYDSAGDLGADLKMLQEALRFGKTLTWPLRAASGAVRRPTEPGPVAPRMGALRKDDDEESGVRRRAERDVPVWMMVVLAFLGAVLLTLLGMWLFGNLNRPKTVKVPNLARLTLPEGRSMLEKLHLELRVSAREPNDKIEANRILDVEPAAGQEVREGSRVYVTLSTGSRYADVPDLAGDTVDKARTILEGLGMEADPETTDRSSPTVPYGSVVETIPPAKSRVERTSRIRLVVSSGPPANGGDADAAYDYRLTIQLSDLKAPSRVKLEMTDSRGTRTVFEDQKQPNDTIQLSARGYGKKASFRIYYGDEFIKEFDQSAQ
jgi:serine/threonine-protein kinase